MLGPSGGATASADAPAKDAGAAAAPEVPSAPAPAAAPAASAASDTGARRVVTQPEAQPIDLLDAAGAPLAKRLIPAGLVLVILLLLLRRHRRSD